MITSGPACCSPQLSFDALVASVALLWTLLVLKVGEDGRGRAVAVAVDVLDTPLLLLLGCDDNRGRVTRSIAPLLCLARVGVTGAVAEEEASCEACEACEELRDRPSGQGAMCA